MPATPKAAKQPQDHKIKTTQYGSTWNPFHDLEVPSGALCQVRRVGLDGLIKAGILHSLDSLTGIVQGQVIPAAEGRPTVDVSALSVDPQKLAEVMELTDKVAEYVVIQPKLLRPVIRDEAGKPLLADGKEQLLPLEDRDPETVYTDYVSDEDKMFILNFVMGGSNDLAEFRKATTQAVGSVPAGQVAGNEAQ